MCFILLLTCMLSINSINFSLSGFIFSSLKGFIPCLLRENLHGFCPQWLYIFIPQRIYTMSTQRKLSRILPLVALFIFIPQWIYTMSTQRELSRLLPSLAFFSSLSGFIPCLLIENFHGFCPQWLCIFIPWWIYTVSLQREFSWVLPLVALYFHPSADLHCVSSKRIFTGFALSGFVFSSLSGFTPCLLRENFHGFILKGLYIFIPQGICTVSLQRELSRILPLVALYFHPSEDFYRVSLEGTITDFSPQWLYIFISQRIYIVSSQRELSRVFSSVAFFSFHPSMDLYSISSERTITDFAFSGFVFSSLTGFIPCLLRENLHGFCPQWPFIFIPLGFIQCLLREKFHGFCSQWPLFSSLEDLYHVSSERIVMGFALNGLSFSSLNGFIPCLLRENFHGFYPQWFSIYFKSLIVLSSKVPFFHFCDV